MVDIFIKSYSKDFKLLKYALLSIIKNVKGYKNVILLTPEYDKEVFLRLNLELPNNTNIFYTEDYGNKYLFQQWCKISAHKYTNSEYIMFSDSDCIFDHEINVDDFIADGKPEILYTDYSKVGDAICWKQPTEAFIKEPMQYEMMRRNCLIYHRSTLEAIEKYEPNLKYIILNSERFSEFNAMSAYAWKYEREKYNFVNTDNWTYTQPKGVQLWSLADKDGNTTHQQEYQRSLNTINKVFGLNLNEI